MAKQKKLSTGVNIQAVAQRAGVSAMTVSNVFHNRGRVGEATRERVKAIIAELGYRPSENALRLQGSRINNIGLIQFSARIESLYVNAMMRAIALAMANKGLHLLTREVTRALPEYTEAAAAELVNEGAQALILTPPFGEYLAHSDYFRKLEIPAVALLTTSPLPAMPTVRFDNRKAMFDIVELLLARGRKRLALITGHPAHADSQLRSEAFREACAAHGVALRKDWLVEGDYTFASGKAAAFRLLSMAELPDAIVALNDDMAAGAIVTAHTLGIKIPEQLAITGFDDVGLASFLSPGLTSIRQPMDAIAQQAVAMIADTPPGGRLDLLDTVVPYTISIRASTGDRPEE